MAVIDHHDHRLEQARTRMTKAKDAFSKASVGVLWGLASTAEVDMALRELDAARAELRGFSEKGVGRNGPNNGD